MYRKSVSPFTVGMGILLLFIMGLNALDGEMTSSLFGRHSPLQASHRSQGPFIVIVGWMLSAAAIVMAVEWIRNVRKKMRTYANFLAKRQI